LWFDGFQSNCRISIHTIHTHTHIISLKWRATTAMENYLSRYSWYIVYNMYIYTYVYARILLDFTARSAAAQTTGARWRGPRYVDIAIVLYSSQSAFDHGRLSSFATFSSSSSSSSPSVRPVLRPSSTRILFYCSRCLVGTILRQSSLGWRYKFKKFSPRCRYRVTVTLLQIF